MGRPSKYSVALATEICRRMAEEGQTLRAICRSDGMPNRETVLRWAEKREDFRGQYARAREALLDYWADEIVEIADDGSNDYMDRRLRNGTELTVINREVVERSRQRIDTRKWLMSKLAPRKYGEFQKIEQDVHVTGSFAQFIAQLGTSQTVLRGVEEEPAPVRPAGLIGNA